MPPMESELRNVVVEWIAFADDDLKAAELLGRGGHARQAAYHAQQAAEKFIKAALIRHQVKFEARSHEIYDLRHSLSQAAPDLASTLEVADFLSRFATARRYPGGGRPVNSKQAEEAVRAAQTIAERVRVALASFLEPPAP